MPPPPPRSPSALAARSTSAAKPHLTPPTPPIHPYHKHRSLILAIGIAAIAASGALIGASFRTQYQAATAQGQSLFSTFSSSQTINAEASASTTTAITNTDTAPKPPSSLTQAEKKEASNDITAQISLLETQRAALFQQRHMTEKKMQGLRERMAAKEEREKEDGRRRALRKYGN